MKSLSMPVVNTACAGIDVGSRFHMVAIDQHRNHVRKFGVYTEDHQALINWLQGHGITSVAMESTGNYWQTLFDALQRSGMEVLLVNGNQTKNVKGKKTDMLDCLWIQKLHAMGILGGSFLPAAQIQSLRTYYNHRQHLISQCSRYINKMQKSLRLMNIRLDLAVNDIMGLSGRTIIEAILAGETDPVKLAGLVDYRVRKSRSEIALALEGNRRSDLLFELRCCLELYDFYCQKIRDCDNELSLGIEALLPLDNDVNRDSFVSAKIGRTGNKHQPDFDAEYLCTKYYGVNLMSIPNVGANTVLCLLTSIGREIYKFPSSKHFCSWLRLSPDNKVTGGKIISSRTPKGKNKLAIALRQAANTAGNQKQGDFTAFFKRIAYKKGRAAAITATARKFATIIYQMITRQEHYRSPIEKGITEKVKNKIIKNIKLKLDTINLTNEQIMCLFTKPTLTDT